MNAIDLLEQQHREVEDLFEEYRNVEKSAYRTRQRLCQKIADQLAVHGEIEAKLFYPESKQPNTEQLLRQAVEEHLAIRRILADLLEIGPDDPQFEAKMQVVEEQVDNHVEEEEEDLFPRVSSDSTPAELLDLGRRMEELADEIEARGNPRDSIRDATDAPSEI